ncbi:MAG: esterase [Gammaproteobacteria bacterium]|jgi:phospholipase/lecithinase/hemolysin|nr:esterase [Gammaproteobacteria bacterium]
MLKKILGLTIGLGLAQLAFAGLSLPYFSQYYFFGDSLSDMGNFTEGLPQTNCYLNFKPNAPVTNTVSQGGTNAGKVWADITAYGFSASPSNNGGNDYAVAGNTTEKVFNAQDLDDPTTQINKFLADHHGQANPQALYVIWAGSNDLIHLINPPSLALTTSQDPRAVIQEGMNNIFAGIDRLYEAGARNFLVLNLPDVSETPAVSNPTRQPDDSSTPAFWYTIVGDFYSLPVCPGPNSTCASLVQEGCDDWDQVLFGTDARPTPGTAPLKFLKAIHPDITIYEFNLKQLLRDLVSNPSHFGYPATIKFNTQYSGISDGIDLPNNQTVSCGNNASGITYTPDDYIFYDYIHPTSYTHTQLAKYIRQGSDSTLGRQYLSLVTAP